MIRFGKKRKENRVDPTALLRETEETLKQVKAQQPKVNFLSAWLEARNTQNGFGEDFDITTLHPRRP